MVSRHEKGASRATKYVSSDGTHRDTFNYLLGARISPLNSGPSLRAEGVHKNWDWIFHVSLRISSLRFHYIPLWLLGNSGLVVLLTNKASWAVSLRNLCALWDLSFLHILSIEQCHGYWNLLSLRPSRIIYEEKKTLGGMIPGQTSNYAPEVNTFSICAGKEQ